MLPMLRDNKYSLQAWVLVRKNQKQKLQVQTLTADAPQLQELNQE